MTTTTVATGTEEKSAADMIKELEDYTRRFRDMRKKNPARMLSMSDMISYNETMTLTLNAMMQTLFAYMDLGIQQLQDSGIGTEAVRPFITLTEQALVTQSKLVLMVCKAAGYIDENGITEKMPQDIRAAFSHSDSLVSEWVVKRDSFLEHLSKVEAERLREEEEEEDEEEDEEDDEEEDEEEPAAEPADQAATADPSGGGEAT